MNLMPDTKQPIANPNIPITIKVGDIPCIIFNGPSIISTQPQSYLNAARAG